MRSVFQSFISSPAVSLTGRRGKGLINWSDLIMLLWWVSHFLWSAFLFETVTFDSHGQITILIYLRVGVYLHWKLLEIILGECSWGVTVLLLKAKSTLPVLERRLVFPLLYSVSRIEPHLPIEKGVTHLTQRIKVT